MRRLPHLSKLDYLLDENISHKTFSRLTNANMNVKSVKTENLQGIKNSELIILCKKEKWILVTHDKDFLSSNIKDYYGLIIINIHPATDEVAGSSLLKFLLREEETEIVNRIIILEEKTWRYKQ